MAAPLVLSGALLLVAAPFVWPVAAVFYLASALTQRAYHGLDAHRPASSGRESTVHALRHGFRHLWSQPTLRRITAANMLHNAGVMSANTLLPVIALTTLGISPAAFAAVGAAGAVAGIGGAISASAITERLGLRDTRVGAGLAVSGSVAMVLGLALGTLPGPAMAWITASQAITSFCSSLALVAGADLVARLSPRGILGSVTGSQQTFVLGVMPLAALAVGALGSSAGMVVATVAWLTFALGSTIPCLRLTDPGPDRAPPPPRQPRPGHRSPSTTNQQKRPSQRARLG